MRDTAGRVLTKEDEILKRWKEYFVALLNEESQRTVRGDWTTNEGVKREVTREEVAKAVEKMNNEAIGTDDILVAAWRSLREPGINKLTELMRMIWNKECIPAEWRRSIIIPYTRRREASKTVIIIEELN